MFLADIMKNSNGLLNRQMLINSLALLLAVRCQQEEAVKQILARIYHQMPEQKAKSMMMRTIMLLTGKERDWLKSLG